MLGQRKRLPERLIRLLMMVVQWVPINWLNESLDLLEDVFCYVADDARERLFNMFFRELAGNFNVVQKDHCVQWFMRLFGEMNMGETLMEQHLKSKL